MESTLQLRVREPGRYLGPGRDSREEMILRRRGHEDLALLPADELRSLKATAHLLRSPKNAARLLKALARSRGDGGIEFDDIEALAAAGLKA